MDKTTPVQNAKVAHVLVPPGDGPSQCFVPFLSVSELNSEMRLSSQECVLTFSFSNQSKTFSNRK